MSAIGKDEPSLKIGFGANNDTRNIRHATEIDDLVVHNLDHIKGISRCHRVYEDIAMNSDHMLRTQNRIFILLVE